LPILSLTIGNVTIQYDGNKVKSFVVNSLTPNHIVILSYRTFFNPLRAVLPSQLRQAAERMFSAIYQIDSVHHKGALAFNLADMFFGLLANFWEKLINTGRMNDAKHYLEEICSVATTWENQNAQARIVLEDCLE